MEKTPRPEEFGGRKCTRMHANEKAFCCVIRVPRRPLSPDPIFRVFSVHFRPPSFSPTVYHRDEILELIARDEHAHARTGR